MLAWRKIQGACEIQSEAGGVGSADRASRSLADTKTKADPEHLDH